MSAMLPPPESSRTIVRARFGRIQLERLFGGFQQWYERLDQQGATREQLIADDFAIATGQHAAQLASAPVALFGK